MKCKLVLIHGRSQEHKDATSLKREWLTAWTDGLVASGLTMSFADDQIRFPYYGQTLYDLVNEAPNVADVVVKHAGTDDPTTAAEHAFFVEVLAEALRKGVVTEGQVNAFLDLNERGLLNKGWVQAVLEAIDRHVPLASSASVRIATNDVHQYLTNTAVQRRIEDGVRQAMDCDVPMVVVSHSLGTVVAYNLLRKEGTKRGWRVPLFVTLGSPLAINAVKRRIGPPQHPACVGTWFNAMDERDVVALYPLDEEHFPVKPSVENRRDVDNPTPNRHGISGYLGDANVARRIYDALTSEVATG